MRPPAPRRTSSFNSTVGRRACAVCTEMASSTRPREPLLAAAAPAARDSTSRQRLAGMRSCTSRKRWFTVLHGDADRRAVRLRASARRNPVIDLIMRVSGPAALPCVRPSPSAALEQLALVQLGIGPPPARASSSCVPTSTMVPVLEHEDRVGAAHGGQAVGDDERRAVAHQRRQRVLHELLGFGVERRGRLVEDQDRRVAQQRAGDRQPLPLPARQALAALADLRRRSRRRAATMNSCACAARAAASMSACVAVGRP